jgi:hypothetical protein
MSYFGAVFYRHECTIGGTFFGKRIVFEEMNGFTDIPYSEDSEFCERAAAKYKIMKVII